MFNLMTRLYFNVQCSTLCKNSPSSEHWFTKPSIYLNLSIYPSIYIYIHMSVYIYVCVDFLQVRVHQFLGYFGSHHSFQHLQKSWSVMSVMWPGWVLHFQPEKCSKSTRLKPEKWIVCAWLFLGVPSNLLIPHPRWSQFCPSEALINSRCSMIWFRSDWIWACQKSFSDSTGIALNGILFGG